MKISTALTRALGNIYTNFDLSTFFVFRVTSPYGTDGDTGKANRAMRPIGRPFNNCRNAQRLCTVEHNSTNELFDIAMPTVNMSALTALIRS